MYYDKERDDFNNRTATRMKEEADEEVKLAIRLAKSVKYLKIVLAVLLIGSYFYKPQYLTELLIIALSVSLLLPQSFMGTYLEKLIDLRAAESDERQFLMLHKQTSIFLTHLRKLINCKE